MCLNVICVWNDMFKCLFNMVLWWDFFVDAIENSFLNWRSNCRTNSELCLLRVCLLHILVNSGNLWLQFDLIYQQEELSIGAFMHWLNFFARIISAGAFNMIDCLSKCLKVSVLEWWNSFFLNGFHLISKVREESYSVLLLAWWMWDSSIQTFQCFLQHFDVTKWFDFLLLLLLSRMWNWIKICFDCALFSSLN
jgi:hypothetical protein